MATKKAKKEGAEGEKPKKPKSSSSKKKKDTEKVKDVDKAPAPVEPEPNDPDAIQLFRRYDREKLGHITRVDFMQLLQDYTASYPQRKWDMALSPCALTDAAGIPLGFERTARNSEFEAGQLFERYDSNRSGSLDLKEFHSFFRDFKKQLVRFVGELQSPREFKRFSPSFAEAPAWSNESQRRPPTHTSTRHLYEARLDQLNRLCDTVLLPHRTALLEKAEAMRRMPSPWSSKAFSPFESPRTSFEEVEAQGDADAIDRIVSSVKAMVYRGHHVSSAEMHQFLDEFPKILSAAEEIVHKVQRKPEDAPSDETARVLKVKDQMIWGLLRERKELRQQRDALEAQLREVSELSAQEMRKWAK
ncbi:hypothetical protein ACHHYP_01190 [Achlya hypogyna]|uniref:EF-hand domain-containing protein n=1 Tax=Achlya hypogyna TaxID=1202772 RepID=A0A1V9ZTR5_ACHHY|nr:hypothetical protein ACHHYP_01190 [Achlya hypogyna]